MTKTYRVAKLLTLLIIPFAVFIFSTAVSHSQSESNMQTPIWTAVLPHLCAAPAACETSSPAIADVNNDGIADIVVATSNGHVVAVRNDGTILWDKDTAPHFGAPANSQQINSSPAVADIDNDGDVEIVVGIGTTHEAVCTQGGVIAFDHNGNFLWRFLTFDEYIPPSGCRDSIFSTPAIGDLDNNGDLEIVVGGFDKRIYVLHHDGSLDPNFPIDSHHTIRFPDWHVLYGRLADTIWGSASLADINGDGYLDILIGTDEGNFSDNFPSPEGWVCPYAMPSHDWPLDYCGGSLYVIDRFGNHLPGFPIRIHETLQSSPAVYDIDSDGDLEIFAGAGTFYNLFSPDHPTMNFRIYGWDHQGNELPGWEGGKVTGGSTPAEVALGDIAGDGTLEVIALSMDHKLYAWTANGTAVPGFPMTPVHEGGNSNPYNVGYGPTLGDYDGDGKMEIFMRVGWGITIVDGNGQQLTTSSNPPNAPMFYAYARLDNNPALGDIDNDGNLEMVAFNGTLHAWDLPNASGEADWPMFRQNPARTGHPQESSLSVSPRNFNMLHAVDNPNDVELVVYLRGLGNTAVDWTTTASAGVTVSPANGQVGSTPTAVTITVDRSSLVPGANNDTVTISGTVAGTPVANSPVEVSITVNLVDQVFGTYLPIILR